MSKVPIFKRKNCSQKNLHEKLAKSACFFFFVSRFKSLSL